MTEEPEALKKGLDQVLELQPGHGFLKANVQASSTTPLTGLVEVGKRFSPNWAAFGDAWLQPTQGKFGGDVGARFGKNVDIFAQATGDTHGNYGADVGVRWTF